MSHNKRLMSVIISQQRRPAVIFVAANVRAIRSHSPDQIRAETCTDGFDKNTVFNQEGEIYFSQLLFFNVTGKKCWKILFELQNPVKVF